MAVAVDEKPSDHARARVREAQPWRGIDEGGARRQCDGALLRQARSRNCLGEWRRADRGVIEVSGDAVWWIHLLDWRVANDDDLAAQRAEATDGCVEAS